MKKLIFLLGLLAVAGVGIYGCSNENKARLDVAKKNVLEKIDDMLGKMDVQKAEIDNGIKSAKQAAEGVRKAKVRAQVQLDQLTEKVRPFEEKLAACDATLVKLRDALATEMPATFAGKTYSVDELKAMAGKIIAERKKAEAEINGFKAAREAMTKQVTLLTETQQKIETKVANLQAQVARLDGEIAAAKAMKQASAAMGDGGVSLEENLNELERKIAGLAGDARAELASEMDRWNVSSAEKAISEVDAFIQAAKTPGNTIDEIDAILGKKK